MKVKCGRLMIDNRKTGIHLKLASPKDVENAKLLVNKIALSGIIRVSFMFWSN